MIIRWVYIVVSTNNDNDMMDWNKLMNSERMHSASKVNPSDPRSPFEKDYNRILFSSHFRRLQGKTQVFPLPTNDFIHNRLTHSLEVARVGESLGRICGSFILDKNQELKATFSKEDFGSVIAAACLAHDIGNPPFGHSGEKALSEYFKKIDQKEEARIDGVLDINPELKGTSEEDIIIEAIQGSTHLKQHVTESQWLDLLNIEGNATGFRIVTRSDYTGFDLTAATLGTFTKYPWNIAIVEEEALTAKMCPHMHKKLFEDHKYGFYQNEEEIFKTVAEKLGLIKLSPTQNIWCRHPLAFLVEAADDICYRLIDFEDGFHERLISFEFAEKALLEIAEPSINKSFYSGLKSDDKIGYLRGKAIFNLIFEAVDVFKNNYDVIMNGEYCGELINETKSYNVLARIKKDAIKPNVYKHKPVLELEIAGFEVLEFLVKGYIDAVQDCIKCSRTLALNVKMKDMIPEQYIEHIGDEEEVDVSNSYFRILNVIEFISGMTDSYAVSMYRKFKGIDIPK